jgi:hypothetical protein
LTVEDAPDAEDAEIAEIAETNEDGSLCVTAASVVSGFSRTAAKTP